jgi:hypothetical protein
MDMKRVLRSSLQGKRINWRWVERDFEHVPAQPKKPKTAVHIFNCLLWVMINRYEKEFDQVQDVFELQVCILYCLPLLHAHL